MIRDKETQRLKMPGLKLLQRNYINEEARKMTKVRHMPKFMLQGLHIVLQT